MDTYTEGTSIKETLDFYDENGDPVPAETLLIIIRDETSGKTLRRETVTPSASTYDIDVTVEENTLQGGNTREHRKIIAKWSFNAGASGHTHVKEYILEAP